MAEFPVEQINDSTVQIKVDLRLYHKDALCAALYRYSDRFFIHQQVDDGDDSLVRVCFEDKTGAKLDPAVLKQFSCDLIDEQLRFNINQRCGHIRDLIVEEAFRPVNSRAGAS